ncbi:hypothetical protein, partial [Escherichia sp. MOD1-EC6163]|uniref:hypothetical protein n=1 Tax=Escherichia sp. MOD1-EC6163 TaxID=2093896 RepID=UPI001F320C51
MAVTVDIHRYPPAAICDSGIFSGENAGPIYQRYGMPGVAGEISMPVQIRGDCCLSFMISVKFFNYPTRWFINGFVFLSTGLYLSRISS